MLVAKDQQIAELEQRVRDLEALQVQRSGDENLVSGSADAAQDDRHAWESLPPPESFKEALEQILMLQVRMLSSMLLAGRGLQHLSLSLSSDGLRVYTEVDKARLVVLPVGGKQSAVKQAGGKAGPAGQLRGAERCRGARGRQACPCRRVAGCRRQLLANSAPPSAVPVLARVVRRVHGP